MKCVAGCLLDMEAARGRAGRSAAIGAIRCQVRRAWAVVGAGRARKSTENASPDQARVVASKMYPNLESVRATPAWTGLRARAARFWRSALVLGYPAALFHLRQARKRQPRLPRLAGDAKGANAPPRPTCPLFTSASSINDFPPISLGSPGKLIDVIAGAAARPAHPPSSPRPAI